MFGQIKPAVKNLLTVASEWSQNQTFTRLNQGTSPQSQIKLRTTTRAVSGAQQVSPALEWEGQGFSSNNSTSIPLAYRAFVLPVQGSPAYASWKLQSSINGAAFSDVLTHQTSSNTGKPVLTSHSYTVISVDNSSTIDTLQSLNVTSSGNQNHIVMSFGSTIRAGWSVDTQGQVFYRSAGSTPTHNFYWGSSIGSQTLIAQIYSNGFYNSYSNFNNGVVTAGSADTSAQTSLSSYGSFAVKGVLVNSASYTLAQTETFVYCDPSNANFCTGTPVACNTYSTQTPCNAHSGVGCSWFSGNSCSPANGTTSSTCTDQGVGCTWDLVSCSGANNTDQTTCEAQDDGGYGGSCSWDTSTCPSQSTQGACQAITGCSWSTTCSASPDESTCTGNGCTWNFSDCHAFDGQSQTSCESGHSGCSWTGADCHAFDGTDQATCETGHTGCTWDSGGNVCNGVYDEASVCNGQYDTSCTGDTCSGNICSGDYNNGNCSGTYGAFCQGTAACSNLTDDGSTACNAEGGCTWTVGITVTLPTTANALRGTTGRIYSVVHVGSTGTCAIQGQTGENIFQYGNITLFKKGDKVLLHNQNISFPCSSFLTQSPCQAQSPCVWNPVITCSSYNGDQTSCEANGCSYDTGSSTCSGAGNPTAYCSGNYTTSNRWYIHSLERGLNYVAKTATYTLTDIDDVVDCTSGTFTLNLPSAALNNGKTYYLKNTGAGTITVDPFSSQTIDGASTDTISAGSSMTIVSNNSNWVKV